MRPTFVEVDLAAIRSNVRAIAEVIAPAGFCAVVKADAYGHGDVPVAGAALEAGATLLAVALVEEGVRLREGGVDAPILVLSEAIPEDSPQLAEWELTPTVYSQAGALALASHSAALGPVHVKVDTGMHRVGTPPRLLHDLMRGLSSAGLEVGALWTHFPVADEDPVYTREQIERFERAISNYDVPAVHMANTAGALLFPEARGSFCRVGLGMYGLHPCGDTGSVVDLEPAMRLVSLVSHVQRLEAGARPSYGRRRPLPTDATVVTVPIGYADGYSRLLTANGQVLIGGSRFPLAGTVTMDQIVVEVGDLDVSVGDEVVLLGSQGGESVPAEEWAANVGTISYEVVCGIGPRVPRRYLR